VSAWGRGRLAVPSRTLTEAWERKLFGFQPLACGTWLVPTGYQQARDKITEYREGGPEKVKRDVTAYAREEPMTALLLAASVGLVLGWLTAAGRR
jgi:hypothetical protein